MSLWSSVSHALSDSLFLEDRNSVGIDHTHRHRRLSFLIWSIAHRPSLCSVHSLVSVLCALSLQRVGRKEVQQ